MATICSSQACNAQVDRVTDKSVNVRADAYFVRIDALHPGMQ